MVPLTTDNNQDAIKASKVLPLKLRSHGYLKCDLGDQLTKSTAILQLQKEEAMAKSLKEVVKFKQFQTGIPKKVQLREKYSYESCKRNERFLK